MKPDSVCLISVLGLRERDKLVVKMILNQCEKTSQKYKYTDSNYHSHIIVVNEDHVEQYQKCLRDSMMPAPPVMVLIKQESTISSDYEITRPISPSKMNAVFDKVFAEQISKLFEAQLFKGKEISQNSNTLNGIPSYKKRNRALIVDDSPTVCRKLLLELASYNISADIAETGEAGFKLLEEHKYDIIFLDVVLPGIDGYEMCKKIRSGGSGIERKVPIVMLTSRTSRFDQVRGHLAGCNSYVTKPVEYAKFNEVIQKHLMLNDDKSQKFMNASLVT